MAEKNAEYLFKILNEHQEKCAPLVFVDNDMSGVECPVCNLRVDKGPGTAIIHLKGYDIELV